MINIVYISLTDVASYYIISAYDQLITQLIKHVLDNFVNNT